MVLEGSSSLSGVVELGLLLETKYIATDVPKRFYLITDGSGDRKTVHLSVQKYPISLFWKYNFEEIIANRPAAGYSFYNPIERIHAIGNLGLLDVGMRKDMGNNMECLVKHAMQCKHTT